MEKNSEFSCLPSDITDFGTTPIFGLHILRQIILNLTTVRIEMEPSIFWNGTIITCSEKFVSMCEMCYAHTHTSRGYWKMNSSTIAQPMQPKV